MRRQLLRACCVVLVALSGPGASHAAAGGASSYVALDPAIVVNISSGARSRLLQIEAQLKLTDPQQAGVIQQHAGAIRHQLILLFSSQSVESVASSAGKDRLRADALAAIQRVLQDTTGDSVVNAVYFTNFVVQ